MPIMSNKPKVIKVFMFGRTVFIRGMSGGDIRTASGKEDGRNSLIWQGLFHSVTE